MAQKFKEGDVAYIVESNRFIKEVMIKKYAAGSYIIKFMDSDGGIRVHESRLYPNVDEARDSIRKWNKYYLRNIGRDYVKVVSVFFSL